MYNMYIWLYMIQAQPSLANKPVVGGFSPSQKCHDSGHVGSEWHLSVSHSLGFMKSTECPVKHLPITRPGKHTKNYGKTTIFNGKIHYFYGHFQ